MQDLKRFILIDCNNLVHMAHHVYGPLVYKGIPTGVLFGFFNYLKRIVEQNATERVVFCFDGEGSLRKTVYPPYKANRQKASYDTHEKRDYESRIQQQKLLPELLREIGYVNIFQADGYEADDWLAAIAEDAIKDYPLREAVVVSGDKDLYQILDTNILIWSPVSKTYFTAMDFERQYGIAPSLWATVKSIGGCSSDNVKTVEGVGELRAIQFLKGEMKEGDRLRQIREWVGSEQHKTVLSIVELPYHQLRKDFPNQVKLKKQPRISPMVWNRVMKRYDLQSLLRGGY